MRNTIVCLLTASMAMGCGGSTLDPAGSGASAGTGASGGDSGAGGGSGAGGSGGAAASAGTGGFGGEGAMGGTGGAQCSDFADETPPPEGVTIRLVNKRATPIYLGDSFAGCGPLQHYSLDGPMGSVQLRAGGCGNTCAALQEHPDYCAGACMIPPVVAIHPGGSFYASWAGTTFEAANMPASCYFDPGFAPTTCDRQIVAPIGWYVASARAWTQLSCDDYGFCSCEPDPSGSCEIPFGANPSGMPIDGKATFEMPSASLVQITFE
jgi:hypothetical protein